MGKKSKKNNKSSQNPSRNILESSISMGTSSEAKQRGRIHSAEIIDMVEELALYLDGEGENLVAGVLRDLSGTTSQKLRGFEFDSNGPEWLSILRAKAKEILLYAETRNKTITPLLEKSITEIVFSYALGCLKRQKEEEFSYFKRQKEEEFSHLKRKNEELKAKNDDLASDLFDARAVYEPRVALEKVVGGSKVKDKAETFLRMFMTNEKSPKTGTGIQQIFANHFDHRYWDDGEIIGDAVIPRKGEIVQQLFDECWTISCDYIHQRTASAPPFPSIVIAFHHYKLSQRIFFKVIGDFLGKDVVIV